MQLEIEKLKKRLKKYDSHEKRLIQLFGYGKLNSDSILDEINKIKTEHESDTLKLEALLQTKEKIESLEKAEIKLAEYCHKLKSHLLAASYKEKLDILDMLAIKITATTDAIKIEGVIPLETTPSSELQLASVEPTYH